MEPQPLLHQKLPPHGIAPRGRHKGVLHNAPAQIPIQPVGELGGPERCPDGFVPGRIAVVQHHIPPILQLTGQRGQKLRPHQVVAVHKGEPCALRRPDGLVARGGLAAVFPVQHPHLPEGLGVFLADRPAAVGGAIVCQKHFIGKAGRAGLVQQAVQAGAQIGHYVIHRNNNTQCNSRVFHEPAPFCANLRVFSVNRCGCSGLQFSLLRFPPFF